LIDFDNFVFSRIIKSLYCSPLSDFMKNLRSLFILSLDLQSLDHVVRTDNKETFDRDANSSQELAQGVR